MNDDGTNIIVSQQRRDLVFGDWTSATIFVPRRVLFRGARGLSQPPIDDIESYWSPSEKAQAARMLARSIIGSPETVRSGIEALVAETGADELIVVSDVYDHAKRLRSFELIANAAGIAA
jgi:alkanesulfonate monooxygenase SsuD/methylene tetrahydromethanopterin reductase-like flavin-dependent oxidoreductase (luciferase family)